MHKILTKKFWLFIWSFLMLNSCEKVVELDLKDSAPKLVVEAMLTNEIKVHQFYLSESLKFAERTQYKGVAGALVVLKDNVGNTYNFKDDGNGTYSSPRMRGIPGRNYSLTINYKGNTISAQSTMPNPVTIDLLAQTESTFFNETRKAIEVTYKDPANSENFYYFKTIVNGELRPKLYVESDRFTNGKQVKNVLYFDEPDLVAKDQVNVSLYTIDANVFRYLFTIAAIDGGGGPPIAPANPDSNLSAGTLGYFSASTVSEKFIVLK